jgi:hypothetical protein
VRTREYADGMQAYLDGRYRDCVDHLERWLGPGLEAEDVEYAHLAYAAVSRLAQWIEREREGSLALAASNLAGRLRASSEQKLGSA